MTRWRSGCHAYECPQHINGRGHLALCHENINAVAMNGACVPSAPLQHTVIVRMTSLATLYNQDSSLDGLLISDLGFWPVALDNPLVLLHCGQASMLPCTFHGVSECHLTL